MFTGLIEEVGSVQTIQKASDGIFLTVSAQKVLEGTQTGDSISINGACQTVTSLTSDSFTVFVSKVTEEVTTLGKMKQGHIVNLERAMTHESRFGGHIVQGHVDGTAAVQSIQKDQNGIAVTIQVSPEILKYVVSKGSIAVDGISLTVVSLADSGFTLYLIPETLQKTNIKHWKSGTVVNIETDILAKYVEKMLTSTNDSDSQSDKKLLNTLMEEGYM